MSASTGIYDRMTAWELVEYFGRLYGLTGDRLRERMEAIFGWLQMNDFRDVLGSKMSTGMKQKVSIARTIVHDPPVLIFDEPTSGLDVLVARAVLQKIAELRDQGKTILLSTHSMHEVEKLCARVAIIHKGRVQAEGTQHELLERYDQPNLEELFFHLVEQAEAATGRGGPLAVLALVASGEGVARSASAESRRRSSTRVSESRLDVSRSSGSLSDSRPPGFIARHSPLFPRASLPCDGRTCW